jgi:hypothetical protein
MIAIHTHKANAEAKLLRRNTCASPASQATGNAEWKCQPEGAKGDHAPLAGVNEHTRLALVVHYDGIMLRDQLIICASNYIPRNSKKMTKPQARWTCGRSTRGGTGQGNEVRYKRACHTHRPLIALRLHDGTYTYTNGLHATTPIPFSVFYPASCRSRPRHI